MQSVFVVATDKVEHATEIETQATLLSAVVLVFVLTLDQIAKTYRTIRRLSENMQTTR